MADSQYPSDLDDDTILIRVDNNITENGGTAINALRSAVFNIEETLGINPQGSANDIVTRLDQSLNADGTIKASALTSIGLVTLPIVDSMVGTSAGIKESKLDLNYSTKSLRELIGALRIEHDALVSTVQDDITNLSRHSAHPATFGRHYTSDIDGYIGDYSTYNLQGIINDLNTRITNHVDDTSDAHDASAISFDDTNTYINANEVQTAIEEIDSLGYNTLVTHQDIHHSNGVLNAQKVYESGTNHGKIIVSSAALNVISSGSTNVAFTVPPSELADVVRGDRIDITIDGITYTRDIKYADSSTGIVYLFVALPVGGVTNTGVIYNSIEEVSSPSVLNIAVRHDSISGNQGGSIVQLIHPSSPFVLSDGLDVRAITSTAKNVKFAWENGDTGDIDIYQALQTYPVANSTPSIWTPENLAIALNYKFKEDGNVYPLIAFTYKGEVGIAFDEPDGYVSVQTPSSNSALSAFGFNGNEIDYSLTPRKFYIDGYEFSTIRKIVDATGVTDGSSVIKSISVDLTSLGIGQTGIVRIKNHADAGTYAFNSSSINTLTISSHIGGFATDSSVSIEIYSDYFAVPTTSLKHTLYELFVDAYGEDSGELKAAPRVEYLPGGSSTADPQKWFNILEISRNFTIGTKRINFENISGVGYVKIGDPVTSPSTSTDVTNPGTSFALPSSNEPGYKFRLYDYNNVDYVDLEITSDYSLSLTDQAIDLIVYPRISEEKYLQIGQVLHDNVRFKNLSDRRLTGTVGRKDIRNDFSRDYVSYPRSLTRGNGVIHGCEVSGSLVVGGGEVLVDGNIYSINRTGLEVPNDGVSSYYNVFIDSDGIIRFLQDDQEIISSGFYTPSTKEIILSSDKVLLARVLVNSIGSIAEKKDLRRFVNNLDNKIDIVVAENSYETFATLQSAVNFLNILDNDISSPRKIKIRGRVALDQNVSLPADCILEGDTIGTNSIGSRIEMDNGSIKINYPNIILRNLTFYSSVDNSDGLVGNLSGGTIINARIENCTFQFASQSADNIAFGTDGIYDSVIQGCYFVNVDYGIIMSACERTIIRDCFFNEVYTSAITLDDVEDTIIENNIINTSSHSLTDTDGIIKLIDPVRCIIDKNIFKTTYTGTSSGNAIFINDTSEYCVISNNYLINTGSNDGLKRAILFDSSDTIGLALSHTYDTIKDNTISGFNGGSCEGLYLVNCWETNIVGNKILNCRNPINAAGCILSVVDNFLESSDNCNLLKIIEMGGIISGTMGSSIIGNNFSSTTTTYTENIVYFNGNNTSTISNNRFLYRPVGGGTSTKAMLYIYDCRCIVNNNIFQGYVYGATEGVITLDATSTNCLIHHNDFTGIYTPDVMIEDNGTYNIDEMNKGQSYNVFLPQCNVYMEKTENGVSTWYTVSRDFKTDNAKFQSSYDSISYQFSSNIVPIGAKLDSFTLKYSISTGAVGDLELLWLELSNLGTSSTTIMAATNPSSTGLAKIETFTPDSTEYMDPNKYHSIRIRATNSSGTYDMAIYGVEINYTL